MSARFMRGGDCDGWIGEVGRVVLFELEWKNRVCHATLCRHTHIHKKSLHNYTCTYVHMHSHIIIYNTQKSTCKHKHCRNICTHKHTPAKKQPAAILSQLFSDLPLGSSIFSSDKNLFPRGLAGHTNWPHHWSQHWLSDVMIDFNKRWEFQRVWANGERWVVRVVLFELK